MTLSLHHALSEVRKNFTSLNWWRNRVFVPFVIGTATRLHPRYPGYEEAISVMDQPWDNLIVLDACRADFFEEVADLAQYDEYERVVSLGSHSSEWTRRNFQGKEFGDTIYISANPHTSLEAGDSFYDVIELWSSDTDRETDVVLPETVRDQTIDAYHNHPDKRLIAHFMQPHGPLMTKENGNITKREREYRTSNQYWSDYKENLSIVLEYALDIADSVPGRTVITADHGQIFNTGLRRRIGLNAHPPRLRLPALVVVPWAVIDDDRRNIVEDEIHKAQRDRITENLKKLGYLE